MEKEIPYRHCGMVLDKGKGGFMTGICRSGTAVLSTQHGRNHDLNQKEMLLSVSDIKFVEVRFCRLTR